MQQKVELDRLLDLEQGIKRLNRTLEEQVAGMQRAISQQVGAAQSAYPESSDVRAPAQDLERLLRETRDMAASISSRLYQKETTLRWAVGQYQSTENQARNLIKTPPSFTWKQTSTLFSKWLQTARDRAAGGLQDLLRSTPTLIEMIKDLLQNVRDASLDKRLQPFVDEAKIASLLEQRDYGSPEEQQEAREQLARIAEALDEIGRSQVAYRIYEKYGNLGYMESASLHAEQQRELLEELGLDPGLYLNVDLRSQYKGSPLSACTYNPLQKDRSEVPSNEELRLAIALGLVNDQYREWAMTHYSDIAKAVQKAELQRELERHMAEYKRLNSPPTTLPDGTPITAENKNDELTYNYFFDKVYDPKKHSENRPLAYYVWLEETYGMTEWRKKVVEADRVTRAFVGGFVESTVMAVVGTVQFGFNYVIDPEKMTQEMVDKATYIFNNPDVIVEAAKTMYKNFEEGTPEEQAKMLGEAASVLVPGLQITKATHIVKVADKVANKVLDPISDAVKKVPEAINNFSIPEFPNLNPFGYRLIPETPGFSGPLKPWNQMWKIERNGDGHGGIEGTVNGGSVELIKPSRIGNPEAVPSGTKTKIPSNADNATKQSLELENDAADQLAKKGYDIEQNPKVRESDGVDLNRDPDFRIEGKIFDCYSPTENKGIRGIWSEVQEKVVVKQQTKNVVINLKKWSGDVSALLEQFKKWEISGLEEVLAITRDGDTISIFP
ncbi:hypothetical protein GCM10010912_68170 [Paenibacillus albidus]|uniref:tRNA nuclease CdiA C-terminal domain-containing protein n=1 Tax=Paenibacillus albidus TaxID=2041023 RepID=A0A917LCS9_9BACL|nr:hypothetical protein [Paenibacillus albidus]GGG14106.1 hypothetical protein GCM10010912_68170 [Paenibacillus albidus]